MGGRASCGNLPRARPQDVTLGGLLEGVPHMRRTWILAAGAALTGAVFTGLLCLPGLTGKGRAVLAGQGPEPS